MHSYELSVLESSSFPKTPFKVSIIIGIRVESPTNSTLSILSIPDYWIACKTKFLNYSINGAINFSRSSLEYTLQ
jgi:hypothetical protein